MINTAELAYERGFKSGAKLYEEMLAEFKKELQEHEEFAKRVDTLLWKGMDWQASGNKEDIASMQSRGIVPCPYNDYKVIAVRSAVDCNDITAISLVVEENV